MKASLNVNKVSWAGLLVALGIVYGDIGTSPLYTFNAMINGKPIDDLLVIGGASLVIWTLTLQTTIKYVMLILQADNKGEGGIFSLYTLVRRQKKWLIAPAMIGGAALLADGMITPPITVTSAIEGLQQIPALGHISVQTIIIIVLSIFAVLFFVQQFGTDTIGKMFGPIMLIWFIMLAVLGISQIGNNLSIFKAFNPYYGIKLLTVYPKGFWILGAVFMCTTGAEALYSDLGHCGKKNIRISWLFVKACLILNYLGQGAFILTKKGSTFANEELLKDPSFVSAHPTAQKLTSIFFTMMPDWFLVWGIIIATLAAIIASQALISGSFTLISEAIRLNLWPRMLVKYPSYAKGQVFIPGINTMLFIGCSALVLYFQSSSNMEAAYGLAITIAMMATSSLYVYYLVKKRVKAILIYLFFFVYLAIEGSFLVANLQKFPHGGYVTFVVAGLLFGIMYVWYRSRKIKNRYVEFVRLDDYVPRMEELSNDTSVPKYATHLVYLTSANNKTEIEHKIMYSILSGKPKRADIYWFVHVDTLDEPNTSEYVVTHIIPNDIIRVEFRLGFKMLPRLNLMFRKVVQDLVRNNEVNITSRYDSQQRNNVVGDFEFIVMEKFLSQDNGLPIFERIIMKAYFIIKHWSLSEERNYGLEQNNVTIEKIPLDVGTPSKVKLTRIYQDENEPSKDVIF